MKNNFVFSAILIGGFLILGIFGRLVPHLWNATPIGAIALILGMRVSWRASFFSVFVIMFVTDVLIGFYDFPVMLSVYGSFALYGVIGYYLRKQGFLAVFGGAIGSTLFFIITNAAVWFFSPMYVKTASGLLQSYTLGLPFYKNMLVGDFAFSVVLYMISVGVYFVITKMKLINLKSQNI